MHYLAKTSPASSVSLLGGFSLLEIILSAAVVLTLSAFALPMGMRFFAVQTFDERTLHFRQTLSMAQRHAFSGYHASASGVALFSDRYVLFEGESYAGRDPLRDLSFPIEAGVEINGPSEVVFAAVTGRPLAPALFTLATPAAEEVAITVSSNGLTILQ